MSLSPYLQGLSLNLKLTILSSSCDLPYRAMSGFGHVRPFLAFAWVQEIGIHVFQVSQ